MSLELAIQENTAALKLLIAALSTAGVVAPATKPVAVPLPTPEVEPQVTPPVSPPAATTDTNSTGESPLMTYEVVKKAMTEAVKRDRDSVVALLTKYNAKRGTDLKPEQYAAFLAELS